MAVLRDKFLTKANPLRRVELLEEAGFLRDIIQR